MGERFVLDSDDTVLVDEEPTLTTLYLPDQGTLHGYKICVRNIQNVKFLFYNTYYDPWQVKNTGMRSENNLLVKITI